MSIDTRDWYRDLLRKKTGYTERAHFRISFGELERRKYRRAWRRNWLVLAAVVTAIAAIAVLR